MCYSCQIEVVDELSTKIDWPELSEARKNMHRAERDARLAKAKTVARVNRSETAELGYVYYIRINQHIKIGYAKDVTKRMRLYPPGSELLAVEPGTMRDEKDRHARSSSLTLSEGTNGSSRPTSSTITSRVCEKRTATPRSSPTSTPSADDTPYLSCFQMSEKVWHNGGMR